MTLDDEPTSPVPVSAENSAGMQKAVLFKELDEKLRSAPGASAERDRTIFWLYYLQGLTADEIAALPDTELSAKGVESALRRVTSWLRTELTTGKPGAAVRPARETGN
jgi:DNA-directed RNA polymerase specialized sigma24 family protein